MTDNQTDQDSSTLSLAIFTILGAVLNIIPAFQTMANLARLLENTPILEIALDTYLLPTFFVIPIIYCIIVTHLTRPKRLVSPLNIQALTVVFGTLLMFIVSFYDAVHTEPTLITSGAYVQVFLLLTIVVGIFLAALGFLQTTLVRWTVGLNMVKVDRLTYSLEVDIKTLKDALNESFINAWGFRRKEGFGQTSIFTLHWSSGESVVIAVGEDPDDKGKSILATVASDYTFYEVTTSKQSGELRDQVILSVRANLGLGNYTIKPLKDVNDPVSIAAYTQSLYPTRSKISIGQKRVLDTFTGIPRYFQWAIGVTAIALLATTLVFFSGFQNFDIGSYLSIVTFLIITLLVEIGIAVRGEMQHGRAK